MECEGAGVGGGGVKEESGPNKFKEAEPTEADILYSPLTHPPNWVVRLQDKF